MRGRSILVCLRTAFAMVGTVARALVENTRAVVPTETVVAFARTGKALSMVRAFVGASLYFASVARPPNIA